MKYDDAIKYNYSVGDEYDTNGSRSFIGFDTVDDVKDYIENHNKKHIYEIINDDIHKLKFDIDFNDEGDKTHIKYFELDRLDDYITIFKRNLETTLKKSDINIICLYSKLDKDNKKFVSSIHFICPFLVMHYKHQKNLISVLNDKYDTKADIKIYEINKQFRLIKQAKFNKPDGVLHYHGEEYPNLFNDCFITHPNNNQVEMTFILHNLFKSDEYEPKTDHKKDHIIINKEDDKEDHKEYNKDILLYTDIKTILPDVINGLDKSFWNSPDWFTVTNIIFKKSLYPIDDWLIISANNSNDKYTFHQNQLYISKLDVDKIKSGLPIINKVLSKYYNKVLVYTNNDLKISDVINFIKINTKEDNKITFKKSEQNVINYNMIEKEYIDQYKEYKENIKYNGLQNYKEIQYLEEQDAKDDKDKDEIPKQFICKTIKKWLISDIFQFQIETGFLHIPEKPVTNYYLDYYNINNQDSYFPNSKLDFVYTIDKMTDTKINDLIDEWLNDDNQIFFCAGAMCGTGKTHFIIRYMLMKLKQKYPILFLTASNSLNKELTHKLNTSTDDEGKPTGYGYSKFTSHTNKSEMKEISTKMKYPNIIISIESIKHIQNHKGHLLILDEIHTLFCHIEANTTGLTQGDKFQAVQIICDLVRNAKKILVSDATINKEQMKILYNMRYNTPIIDNKYFTSIKILQNNFNDYTHNFYTKHQTFKQSYIKSVKNQKNKIAFTSNSCSYIENMEMVLKNTEQIKNKNVLCITSKKIISYKIIDGSKSIIQEINKYTTPNEKYKFFEGIEDYIIKNDIDYILSSPTLTTGVSINSPIFNIQYAYFCNGSNTAAECFQQTYRYRNLKDKQINFYLKSSPKTPTIPLLTADYIKHHLTAYTQQIQNNNNHINNIFDSPEYKIYLDIRGYNWKIQHATDKNVYQEFCNYLSNHNIKFNYITDEKICKVKSYKQELQDIEYNKFVNIPLIDLRDYIELYNNKDNLNENDKMKFDKFNKVVEYDVDNIKAYGFYSMNEIINKDIQYNNRLWFDTYYNKHQIYKDIKKIITFDISKINENIINDKFDPTNTIHKQNRLLSVTNDILKILNIELGQKMIYKYNDFNKILSDNEDVIKNSFHNYLDVIDINYKKSKNQLKDYKNNRVYNKSVFMMIKTILKKFNIDISTNDQGTTHTNSKILINQFDNGLYFNYPFNNPLTNYTRFKYNKDTNETTFTHYPVSKRDKPVTNIIKDMKFLQYNKDDIVCKSKKYNHKTTNQKLYKNNTKDNLYTEYLPNPKILLKINKIITKDNTPTFNEIQKEFFKELDRHTIRSNYSVDIIKNHQSSKYKTISGGIIRCSENIFNDFTANKDNYDIVGTQSMCDICNKINQAFWILRLEYSFFDDGRKNNKFQKWIRDNNHHHNILFSEFTAKYRMLYRDKNKKTIYKRKRLIGGALRASATVPVKGSFYGKCKIIKC